ncbi:hypothetical protein [Aquimarina litoralis]|uniref:hypothetical protein n=1 Tax=Aquimarina litoralis TaxID=584605 RepID=UPI001C5690BE|nr:hypothetical protein [Aquimarina litoralis]MBW1295056.1 hypothetical protein [Aquimarina litoralis]
MKKVFKVRGAVFGSLYPNKIHINVGYGIGMMDGGKLLMIDTFKVPENCRMPNTLVWIISEDYGYNVIKIEKMSDLEAKENPLVR